MGLVISILTGGQADLYRHAPTFWRRYALAASHDDGPSFRVKHASAIP